MKRFIAALSIVLMAIATPVVISTGTANACCATPR